MITKIRKRDGRYVKFNEEKITEAIQKAILAVEAEVTINKISKITKEVVKKIEDVTPEGRVPTVEDVQDIVEKVLMSSRLPEVAKAYILYREERSQVRDRESRLMKTFKEIEIDKKTTSNFLSSRRDFQYENPVKSILSYGHEGAKEYNKMFVINQEFVKLHEEGDIFIKAIEYYNSSFNTLQIDIDKLVDNGLLKDNVLIKKPNNINEFILFLSFILSKAESDLYGGIQIPNFDFLLAKIVKKKYHELFLKNIKEMIDFLDLNSNISTILSKLEERKLTFEIYHNQGDQILLENGFDLEKINKIRLKTDHEINELLLESLTHFLVVVKMMPTKNQHGVINLSISYGTDTSDYGRMVTKNILLATKRGTSSGHLFTTPVQIFKVKEKINYLPKDKNHDLLKLAIETTAKTMYPNFMFLDSSANIIEGIDNLVNLSYGATRNRIAHNTIEYNISPLGRGSIAETVINLPRVALNSKGLEDFYLKLGLITDKVINQLLDRYRILSNLKAFHLPFLMIDKSWRDSSSLNPNDSIAPIIKNGSLDIGFIGLAEALSALTGFHHGENEVSRQLGLEIIFFLNRKIEEATTKYDLNFQLVASSQVDLLEKFVIKDQHKYGIIKGVTDKSFYTDSFHIPSNYMLNAEEKINIEAPYHNLLPGGHITYIELGGQSNTKIDSIKSIIKLMKSKNIGYGAINHHVDFDPECQYYGEISDKTCPKCKRVEILNKPFFKYRRINDLLITPINLTPINTDEIDLRVKHIKNLMRVSGFVNDSIVDGPGLRFVVFTQGCLIGCPGCHNPETWNPDGGTLMEVDDIVKMWRSNPLIEGITISGGDPMLQPDKTLYLVKKAKETNLSVTVYSGKYYQELLDLNNVFINEILNLADILIDGPFEMDKLNLELLYRGSENQRVIDLIKTRESGQLTRLIV